MPILSCMARYGAILLVVWALVGLPTLCIAGALPHDCACGDSRASAEPSDCTHEQPHCSHNGACNHESDCGSDPCSKLTASRPEQYNDVAETVPLVVACPSFAASVSQRASLNVRESFSERVPGKNLPYPSSDLPLLI